MLESITLTINGEDVEYDLTRPRTLTVKETDTIALSFAQDLNSPEPDVYFDDTAADLVARQDEDRVICTLPPAPHLAERFGRSTLRITYPTAQVVVSFDVMAKRATIEQAHRMIKHLTEHSKKLTQACFENNVKGAPGNSPLDDNQGILAGAEGYVRMLDDLSAELFANLRQRLVPVKKPYWQTDMVNYDIDPSDVLSNLDALTPTDGEGDVVINGQHFDMTNLSVDTVEATANVEENQVLLGGLYSIRRKIEELRPRLRKADDTTLQVDGEYGSFAQLQAAFGADDMLARCDAVLSEVEGFIHLFENRFGVRYAGELRPSMTPFSRSTRVYRSLFLKLAHWYGLGEPSQEMSTLPARMRSLTKIYEIYVLFNLLDELLAEGWRVSSYVPHSVLGENVPSEIGLQMGAERLTVRYDPVIGLMGENVQHMDLVDVWHSETHPRPFWTPDFVVRVEVAGEVRYLILDAKYSHRYKVREKHIPETHRKYYTGTAVYDAASTMLASTQIVGVFVVYALDKDAAAYLPHAPGQNLNDEHLRIPMTGGMPLTTTDVASFKHQFAAALNGLRRTLPSTRSVALPKPRLVA
jgi:hypothetical protein